MKSRRLALLAFVVAVVLSLITLRSQRRAAREAELWATATDPVL